jgi:hypothetical protein
MTHVTVKTTVFWTVTPYFLVDYYQIFAETCWKVRQQIHLNCW